ncbi:MAG: hypothetical protein SGI97_10400 [candidate division Zixibacteria bacterium]|nr:hypothetical protein [candidate division Zixibacteria bacterium]
MLRLSLDLPVSAKEAKKRNFPDQTSRLIVECSDGKNCLRELSRALYSTHIPTKALLAQTILCYEKPEDISSVLTKSKIPNWLDRDVTVGQKSAKNLIIQCTSESTVLKVLQTVHSEALVFYNSNLIDSIPEFDSNLIMTSLDGYFEHKFLAFQCTYDFFVFYESTHELIAIFGESASVYHCFETIHRNFRPETNQNAKIL